MHVLGVDAAGRAGWVGVVLGGSGFCSAHLAPTVADLIEVAEAGLADSSAVPGGRLAAIGVDIPIGLVDAPARAADLAARRYVGPKRASSVFTAPHPAVLACTSQAEANELLRARNAAGDDPPIPLMSAQAWNIVARIAEVAAIAGDDRICETFPEASFTAMAGGAPPSSSKKTWAGLQERLARLAATEPAIRVPGDLGRAGAVPADDVVDAAACAWSAWRVARGDAVALGDPTERDVISDRRIAVWV